jgi:hypothetical protein
MIHWKDLLRPKNTAVLTVMVHHSERIQITLLRTKECMGDIEETAGTSFQVYLPVK